MVQQQQQQQQRYFSIWRSLFFSDPIHFFRLRMGYGAFSSCPWIKWPSPYIWKDFMLYHIDYCRSRIKGKPAPSGCSAPARSTFTPSSSNSSSSSPWGKLFFIAHHPCWTWTVVYLDESEIIIIIWAINLGLLQNKLMHMAGILYLYYYCCTHPYETESTYWRVWHCYECGSNLFFLGKNNDSPIKQWTPYPPWW